MPSRRISNAVTPELPATFRYGCISVSPHVPAAGAGGTNSNKAGTKDFSIPADIVVMYQRPGPEGCHG
ncbi:hypothetical protein BURKHO8Y_170105 [Burkholderia sp. 8Y]|nr:hypothetical protein BURKHO8Y_170105 [Burkholderia sp. 8Y]